MRKEIRAVLAVLGLAVISACGAPQIETVSQNDIDGLTAHLMSLGPNVDPKEARRAATVAYTYPPQLAKEYGITDPPLIHNGKVNQGLRPRGICVHWAEDMEARLQQEHFKTLQVHRAIADPVNQLRIDHSSAVITAKGDGMYDGLILDPWRTGGSLHWAPVREDTKYNWAPRQQVLRNKAIEQGLLDENAPTNIAVKGVSS
ncbi:MAG: hypothetical protein ACU0BB_04805 [Paracoccaceae bacterium]